MKKMNKTIMVVAALAVATASFAGESRTQSADGVARTETRVQRSADKQFTVPVDIDLSAVSAQGSSVALGGYVARIDFDKSRVELVDVKGGSAKAFTTAPIATENSLANESGVVKMTAYNVADQGATGRLNVANVTFRELVRGGAATIKVSVESASSTLSKDATGVIRQFEIRVTE